VATAIGSELNGTPEADLEYVAVGLHDPRKSINKLAGHRKILR